MNETDMALQQLAVSIQGLRRQRSCTPRKENVASAAEVLAETDPAGDCTVGLLASGSSGNCAFIRFGETKILIDAGISYRRITQGLHRFRCTLDDISAVFITHEHSDHIHGLPMVLKHSRLPVYTTLPTWQAMGDKTGAYSDRFVRLTKRVTVGSMQIVPFSIPHDAAHPVGYAVYSGGHKVTVATDLGYVTPDVERAAALADILILEANHDEEMVRTGPYPRALQARILGRSGHLSNYAAAELLAKVPQKDMLKVLLAHRSEKNNTPAATIQTMRTVLEKSEKTIGKNILLRLASQQSGVRFQMGVTNDET
ncbi:MBL fold metallo-hydrolase [Megasphaera vaginalis (ex Bordigoni et al. 2020)]|uniref:MBL fold metallo-hydrolase n=1 Tax=Megasphaera vaginalis (ex Bordigoni et al. 2020) TaxID=2045301 RepID=UPI000C7E600F|nr:MBL fold metallo-hydrolase [Megasphaera vaginalis (ex Bordigoni et al. 2020)]